MKYKIIAWAWLSGFDFLSCIYYACSNRWFQSILSGICSILAMGLAIGESKK